MQLQVEKKVFINPRRGMRLDNFLNSKIKETSRSFIQYLIKIGNVKVNGKLSKKNYILKGNEEVTVNLIADPLNFVKPDDVPFKILHNENSFLIIEKPSGVITHPSARYHTGTLLQGLVKKFPELKHWRGLGKPGLVHRLDKETSGIMIVAKNASAQRKIMKQFEKRKVFKTYLAIVDGIVKVGGVIEVPIKRNPLHRTIFSASYDGRQAKTYFKVVKTFKKNSLLLVRPFTGRTHQIRVHLSHIGFPITGDIEYGGKPAKRLFLHAYSIAFFHPETGKRVYFKTKVPNDFSKFINETFC